MWHVEFHEDFVPEFDAFAARVQDAILARAIVLRELGPATGRSANTDSLKGSGFANMKELRVQVGGAPWRVAFAFDPLRRAIVLCTGNKRGKDQRRFYTELIAVADKRFSRHLEDLERARHDP